MANRTLYPPRSMLKEGVTIAGKISLNSSAAVTAPASTGVIPGVTSVTRTSAGLYKITLQDTWFGLYGFRFELTEAALTALFPRVKSDGILLGASNAPNSVSFWTVSTTTATDVTAAVDIYFELLLKNTSQIR